MLAAAQDFGGIHQDPVGIHRDSGGIHRDPGGIHRDPGDIHHQAADQVRLACAWDTQAEAGTDRHMGPGHEAHQVRPACALDTQAEAGNDRHSGPGGYSETTIVKDNETLGAMARTRAQTDHSSPPSHALRAPTKVLDAHPRHFTFASGASSLESSSSDHVSFLRSLCKVPLFVFMSNNTTSRTFLVIIFS